MNQYQLQTAPSLPAAIAGVILVCGPAVGCGSPRSSSTDAGVAGSTSAGIDSLSGTTGSGAASGSEAGGSSEGARLDLPEEGTGGVVPKCVVIDEMNAVGNCETKAPSESFVPDVQWTYPGIGDEVHAIATPLVANLDDDNGDGAIDLCDIPDVVVPLYGPGVNDSFGSLYVLGGEDGELKFRIDEPVSGYANPAVGDIDGDGLVEIVTAAITERGTDGHILAFEHDGTLKWKSSHIMAVRQKAAALADLDADGTVEIMFGEAVFDADGTWLWSAANNNGPIDIPFAVDLDGDGDLEVVHGPRAFHHDGTQMFQSPASVGHAQVANLDDDPEPEVLIAGQNGMSILEHDGKAKFLNVKVNDDRSWWRPAAIHDIDGDGEPEILASSDDHYTAYEADLSVIWTTPVDDGSGFAAGTAFDFLGQGVAQAMYADEDFLYVYDEAGATLLTSPRSSWTQAENPVVADVDNDGSAEIVVVSNGGTEPAVQVIRDVDENWIQARRIWNQHAYHVTNVREDGTIPRVPARSWERLNTFRTQAQIEGGSVCQPPPQG